jgi:hypothetical protein
VPFRRDDALLAGLRAQEGNAAVIDALEATSAHSDLGDVLFRFARSTGQLRVVPLSSSTFPALVCTRAGDDRIVAAASGMQWLLVRVDELPDDVRLHHEPAPELGHGWWRVHPFDPEVSADDAVDELQRWLSAATR